MAGTLCGGKTNNDRSRTAQRLGHHDSAGCRGRQETTAQPRQLLMGWGGSSTRHGAAGQAAHTQTGSRTRQHPDGHWRCLINLLQNICLPSSAAPRGPTEPWVMGWTSSTQPGASHAGAEKGGGSAGCLQPWELDARSRARLRTRRELQRW